MENQPQNLRFLKNEDFASTALELLQNLGQTIIDTESYCVPDEMRNKFQALKSEFLDSIDEACGKIRFMRNYKNVVEDGEDKARGNF